MRVTEIKKKHTHTPYSLEAYSLVRDTGINGQAHHQVGRATTEGCKSCGRNIKLGWEVGRKRAREGSWEAVTRTI